MKRTTRAARKRIVLAKVVIGLLSELGRALLRGFASLGGDDECLGGDVTVRC
jgi:hypothetical protein